MEDKQRTLLAFLFIGLIFLLLPYYNEWMGLNPKPRPEPQGPSSQEQELKPSQPELSFESPADEQREDTNRAEQSRPEQPSESLIETPPVPSPSFVPAEIVVRTPLQEITISTEGGSIILCKLLKYNKIGEGNVQLIPPGGRGLNIYLQQANNRVDLSSLEFVPDQTGLSVEAGENQSISFTAQLGGGKILEKVFSFNGDAYGFDLDLRYDGFDDDTEAIIAWEKGISFTEQELEIDLPEMRAFSFINGEMAELLLDAEEVETWSDKGALNWAGIRNKYFLIACIPADREERIRIVLAGNRQGAGPVPDYSYEIGRRLERSGSWQTTIYLGPLSYNQLVRYEAQLEEAIDPDGWPIVSDISRFLLVLFIETYKYIPNYGWIIVLFAIVIKIIVYPLTHKTYESAAKMQQVQPKITALREKYKNDNQRLSRETMKLYKEEGVNPLGGCLPMLLQMPIFFSLYTLFGKTIELRQSPFALWIQDLSLPDELIIGGFGLHVLPLLMAASLFLQQKMTMKDPKQAMLVYMMPVMMIFIFWSMSSGLVLYWTIFNILTIGQQVLVNKLKGESHGLTLSGP